MLHLLDWQNAESQRVGAMGRSVRSCVFHTLFVEMS